MPHSHMWGCGFLKKQQTIFIYNRRGKTHDKIRQLQKIHR